MQRSVSQVGRDAVFKTPQEEVERIVAHKTNYYICLKVTQDADESEIKHNYLRLSRLVHPDKCNHPDAGLASATLNQAKDTLTNPLKKRLYDAYIDDLAKGQGVDSEGMTYAEWEAKMAAHPVRLPAWLEKILGIKVVGQIVAVILLLLMIPLLLIALVLGLVMWLICIPFNILFRCCCPDKWEEAKRQYEEQQRQQAGGQDDGAYVPPQQAQNV
mmetsp:Transcript_7612/g.15262  ORF Transcript_7612/g.15262 Transcript_7612/m.15262 type:complete len:215 (-) Transcript_7612:62-706(-)